MSETDLSLVVTAHDETLVSGPTIASADLAVAAARAAGYTVRPSSPWTGPRRRRRSTSDSRTSTTGSAG